MSNEFTFEHPRVSAGDRPDPINASLSHIIKQFEEAGHKPRAELGKISQEGNDVTITYDGTMNEEQNALINSL